MALNTEHEQYGNGILHFRCALFGNHCLRDRAMGEKCELATKFSDRQPKRGVRPNPLEPPLCTGLNNASALSTVELSERKMKYQY